ncbi:MAG: hypothetical protein ACKPCJ_13340 [Betaproteobacteria bacterium]
MWMNRPGYLGGCLGRAKFTAILAAVIGDVLWKDTSETGAPCDHVAAALDLIKAAVLAGELDAAIYAASSKVRAGFAK